jgi:hypothetical protein
MRSVLTILLFLILLGAVLLYKRISQQTDGFRGGGGGGHGGGGHGYGRGWESGGGVGGGWNWDWYGVVPYPFYTSERREEPQVVIQHVDSPCSTDLDCPTGHCSMFGICTNGLSL